MSAPAPSKGEQMQPDEPLSATSSTGRQTIPDLALEKILNFLGAKGLDRDRHSIRLACQDLCRVFDGRNTRMTLKNPCSSDRLLALVRRSHRLEDLTLDESFDLSTIEEILSEGSLTKRLQRLDVRCYWKLVDIKPLASCAVLQHLDLSYCYNLVDIKPLASCAALQHLDLSCCSNLVDITALASCTALQHLDLSGCKNVEA